MSSVYPVWTKWLRRFCGWVAGFGFAMLPFPFLQWWVGFGVPGWMIHGCGIIALLVYIGVRSRYSEWVVARTASLTAAVLLFATGLVQWEGHAGGYWKARTVRWVLTDVVRMQREFHDSAGRFAAGIPGSVDVRPGVVDLQIRLTPDGFTASARHEKLDGLCAVYVGSTRLPPATRPEWARCKATGLREQDLVVPLLLAAGGVLLGGLFARTARTQFLNVPSDE
jgi:hypothetical protein